MSDRRAVRQAGFTLTELMVVVTIIGILATMAVVYMRPHVRAIDVATRIGDMAHEAGRRAVALGPVRPDVVTNLGTRTRTVIVGSLTGSAVTFTLYRLQENAVGASPAGSWIPLDSYIVDRNVLAVQWANGIGDQTMAGLTPTWDCGSTMPPATCTGFMVQCQPNGTCNSVTLFFQAAITVPTYEYQAKLSIMQLGGAITTHTDWN